MMIIFFKANSLDQAHLLLDAHPDPGVLTDPRSYLPSRYLSIIRGFRSPHEEVKCSCRVGLYREKFPAKNLHDCLYQGSQRDARKHLIYFLVFPRMLLAVGC